MAWNPKHWASLLPTGIGETKPHHFRGMARIAWENRDRLPYAWRILTRGVCDGCALGTSGVRDATIDGVHLCMVRLDLLRTNTQPGLDPALLADVAPLRERSSKALRDLGRLPVPMRRRRGEKGFTRVSWDEAIDAAASRLRGADPRRVSFYVTSRGITNETYYVAGKVARFLGTNNVDNSARLCHSPSTVALKGAVGWGASTCSYVDWLESDLIVFFGSNTPNNQPVTTKYLHRAKKRGTRVAVVNPYREPGLARYWVPSEAESALFGTKLADEWFEVHTGGDLAFLNGVAKHLLAIPGGVDEAFVRERTSGFEAWKATLDGQRIEELERLSGAPRVEMERFARLLASAGTGILVWSMGLTQHRHGSDTVRALANLGLARGWVGKKGAGLMPIRGHSGVQGGAEVGCAPNLLPGGGLDEANRERVEALWGFPVPTEKGMPAAQSLHAAARGDLDVLWSIGGNFLETLPDPAAVREALARVPFRVHQDIVVTSQMLVDPADEVLLLPATTRYEMPGGGTETSTERRIWFSPEVPGPRVSEARPEWEVLLETAARARPERAAALRNEDAGDTPGIRREIAKAQPLYAGIETLAKKGDVVQWGGRLLGTSRVATPDGKARFQPVAPPETRLSPGTFLLSTRRGKQFNSMVHAARDPLTGAARRDVLVSRADLERLGIPDGAPVRLRRDGTSFEGIARAAPIKPGNVQVHWPEGNDLLAKEEVDPEAGVPDYNAAVTLERL